MRGKRNDKRDDDVLQMSTWALVIGSVLGGSTITMIFSTHVEATHDVWVFSVLVSIATIWAVLHFSSESAQRSLRADMENAALLQLGLWIGWIHLGAFYDGTTRHWARSNHEHGWVSWLFAVGVSIVGVATCAPSAWEFFEKKSPVAHVVTVVMALNFVLPLNESTTNSRFELMWHYSWFVIIFFSVVFRLNQQDALVSKWYVACATTWIFTAPGYLSVLFFAAAVAMVWLNMPDNRKKDPPLLPTQTTAQPQPTQAPQAPQVTQAPPQAPPPPPPQAPPKLDSVVGAYDPSSFQFVSMPPPPAKQKRPFEVAHTYPHVHRPFPGTYPAPPPNFTMRPSAPYPKPLVPDV